MPLPPITGDREFIAMIRLARSRGDDLYQTEAAKVAKISVASAKLKLKKAKQFILDEDDEGDPVGAGFEKGGEANSTPKKRKPQSDKPEKSPDKSKKVKGNIPEAAIKEEQDDQT